ncbi:MAG: YlmH/Sll1252 family protein [Lachnospiraceae bacterium]|nr:YlmH/Sll1252 family protein [Lachnospiraceae bacterium]
MTNEELYFQNRIVELAERSYKCSQYFFTGFLSSTDISLLHETAREQKLNFMLWGGYENAERKMARFGDKELIGYELDFPISIVCIEPILKKFSDEFTHRDFLGSIMNLGIKRETIGDILVMDRFAYVFVDEKIADYIVENLKKVRHTHMKVTRIEALPVEFEAKRNVCKILVSSLRLDVVIAGKYNISRNQALELFRSKKVFLNERLCENNSYIVKQDDIISVRGYGKMVFKEISGETKKGRVYIQVEEYV